MQIEPIGAATTRISCAVHTSSKSENRSFTRERSGPALLDVWTTTSRPDYGVMAPMADIGRPDREIDVRPVEVPLPRELPVEPPAPAPREPEPAEDTVPA